MVFNFDEINKINKIALILFFISYCLFFASLEKCFEGEGTCCKRIKWMKKKLYQEIISCFIISFLFELIILKIISLFHFMHFIIVFACFYRYSHGFLFRDHGYYNFFGFYIIVLFLLFLMIPFYIIIYSKKKIYIYYLIKSLFILYFIYYSIIKINISCDDWSKGLNNSYIDNNKEIYGCQIKLPKVCPYKIGKYFYDKTKLFEQKCLNLTGKTKEKLLKKSKSPYISKNTHIFGYPLMNDDEILLKLNTSDYQSYFLNNLIDVQNLKEISDNKINKPLIKIDFSENPYGKLFIDINFNKTLSEQRKKLEKYNNPYSNNIVILYIDSVSRALSLRQFKKTLNFFENFMPYKGNHNSNFSSDNFHSFQFFKYHSHEFYTIGNYPIIYYGNFRNSKNVHINTYLKENGYITSYCSPVCGKDWAEVFHTFTNKDQYDYKFITCDPNAQVDTNTIFL